MLTVIVLRRIYKTLPIFSSYLLFPLIAFGISYSFRDMRIAVALSFVDSAFIFFILIELTRSVLRPVRPSLPTWTPQVIPYVLVLAYAATWQFMKSLDAPAWSTPYVTYMTCMNLSSSGLQIVFLIGLTGFIRFTNVGRRSRELRIAAGFGLFSALNCWTTILQLKFGTPVNASLLRQYHFFDQLRSLGGICLMLYWTVSFAAERLSDPSPQKCGPGWGD